MPTKPLPPCRWPGCPNLQEPGGNGYCREHQKAAWRADTAKRGSARQRGYTRSYEKVRQAVLARQPLCVICELEGRVSVATLTHHIIPLAEGGSNRADNLLPLCEYCHSRVHGKHGKELLRFLRRPSERWLEQNSKK
jgi:5-methylcytosine-specific restriction protein A